MPPKTPRKLFNYYKAALVEELGRKALDDATINRIGRREFGSAWAGCNAIDRVKFKPNTYQVVFLQTLMTSRASTGSAFTKLEQKPMYSIATVARFRF